MPISLYVLTQITIVAYAFVGGVFLAFSDFIMRALAHTSGTGGVETMQIINREVFRWVFMALFLGLAPVSLFITGFGLFYLDSHPRALGVAFCGAVDRAAAHPLWHGPGRDCDLLSGPRRSRGGCDPPYCDNGDFRDLPRA